MAKTKAPLPKQLAVGPGATGFQLAAVDPAATFGLKKKQALQEIEDSRPELLDLQTRLYAQSRRSLLVVLQGMDTSGKDGAIKHVIGHFNPVDVRITSFKEPTPEERRHGFLWRVRRALPAPGQVGIFNRSHYEDVLVAKVDALVPPAVIEKRYEEICKFEGELQRAGDHDRQVLPPHLLGGAATQAARAARAGGQGLEVLRARPGCQGQVGPVHGRLQRRAAALFRSGAVVCHPR